ncbi:unnamed protein product, partial [marine sediment metagenome]
MELVFVIVPSAKLDSLVYYVEGGAGNRDVKIVADFNPLSPPNQFQGGASSNQGATWSNQGLV